MTNTTSLERCSRCGSQYLFDPGEQLHGAALCPACQHGVQHRGIDALLTERITLTLNALHRGVSWLAAETGISERILLSRLAGQTTWTLSELGDVAQALQARPSYLLGAVES